MLPYNFKAIELYFNHEFVKHPGLKWNENRQTSRYRVKNQQSKFQVYTAIHSIIISPRLSTITTQNQIADALK